MCLSHPIPPLLWSFLRSALPRSFLQFVRPYWEGSDKLLGSSLLEETFVFWAQLSGPPRLTALSQHLQGAVTEEVRGWGWPGTRGGGAPHPLGALGQLDAAGTPSGADPRMGQAGMLQGCSCPCLLSPHPGATRLSRPLLICGGIPQPPKRQNSRAISQGD